MKPAAAVVAADAAPYGTRAMRGREVRDERPDDRRRVFEVQARAFGRADEARLVDALRAATHPHVSLVAVEDGAVVGHVFLSPVTLDAAEPSPPLAGLAPVGVLPERRRRGIGSALIRAALERARAQWTAVFLVGDPAYYTRFGFVLAAPRGFSYGDPRFDAALQVLELRPNALTGRSGRVRFHPAFAAEVDG